VREARRLFYVGVTRPRKELCLIFKKEVTQLGSLRFVSAVSRCDVGF